MSCGFLTTPIFAVEQMKRDGTIGKDPEDAPLYPLARSTYVVTLMKLGLVRILLGLLLLSQVILPTSQLYFLCYALPSARNPWSQIGHSPQHQNTVNTL